MNHITQVEETADGLFVTQLNRRALEKAIESHTNSLIVSASRAKDSVRVASAGIAPNATGYELTGSNAIFYEAPITARELTDDEEEWCDSSVMYSGEQKPETLVETVLPPVQELEDAILNGQLDAYDGLDAVVSDNEVRDRLVRSAQERIEREQFRAACLDSGFTEHLQPEWTPSSADKDANTLHEMAAMRADAHQVDWRDLTGIPYYEFFRRRTHLLDIIPAHARVEPYELVALDIVDAADDWAHCMYCSAVWPESHLLSVARRTGQQTLPVCDACAELSDDFNATAVAKAKDRRARRQNGQRRLVGFTDDSD